MTRLRHSGKRKEKKKRWGERTGNDAAAASSVWEGGGVRNGRGRGANGRAVVYVQGDRPPEGLRGRVGPKTRELVRRRKVRPITTGVGRLVWHPRRSLSLTYPRSSYGCLRKARPSELWASSCTRDWCPCGACPSLFFAAFLGCVVASCAWRSRCGCSSIDDLYGIVSKGSNTFAQEASFSCPYTCSCEFRDSQDRCTRSRQVAPMSRLSQVRGLWNTDIDTRHGNDDP